MIRLLFHCFVLVCLHSPCGGAEPTIPELIELLGHQKFAIREKADRALVTQKQAALLPLSRARNHPDPEVRERIEGILLRIRLTLGMDPTRVTLKVRQKTIWEVLRVLEAQTGFPMELKGDDPGTRYDFDFQNLTFWEAIEKLRGKAKFGTDGYGSHGYALAFDLEKQSSPYSSSHGPIRVEVIQLNDRRGASLAEGGVKASDARNKLLIKLRIVSEPKVRIKAFGNFQFKNLVDEDGSKYGTDETPDFSPTNPFIFPDRAGNELLFEINARTPAKASRLLAKLEGNLTLHIGIHEDTQLISDDLENCNGKLFRYNGCSYKIQASSRQPNRFSFTAGGDEPFEPSSRWHKELANMAEYFQVTDKSGSPFLTLVDKEPAFKGENVHFSLTFIKPFPFFTGTGEPARLFFLSQNEQELSVPVNLKNIRLP